MNNNASSSKKVKFIVRAALLAILIMVFYCMGKWLIPFIISLILAYAFHAPAKSLAKKLKLSSSASAGIIVSILVTGFTFFAIFLIPLIKNSAIILIQKLPRLMTSLPSSINEFLHKIYSTFGIERTFDVEASFEKYMGGITSDLPSHILNFINTGMAVVHIIVFAFMTPIITFYLLKDWSKIESASTTIIRRLSSNSVIETIKTVNSKLASYIKGQLLICCILSILYSIGLYFIGLKEFIVCGICSGFLSFAPFFGPFIGLLTTLAMSLDEFAFSYQYILTCGLYLFIPFLDSNFTTPRLIGKTTGIQPFWILFSICATVSVLGMSGIFISVPMAVVLSTICKEIIKKL